MRSTADRRSQSSILASGLSLAGAVTTMLANFGIVFLVSLEDTATAGIFFASTAMVSILGTVTALGTQTSLVYFLPRTLATERPNPRGLLRLAGPPVLVVSAAVATLVFLGAGPLGELISDRRAADLATSMRILAPAIPAWAASILLLGCTRGLGTVTPTVVVQQLGRPSGQILLLGAVALTDNLGPVWISLAWGAPVLVGAIAAAVAVWRLGGFDSGGSVGVTGVEFWSYALPHTLTTGLQIAVERLDVILVTALLGESLSGIYGGLSRFATAASFIIFAMAQAVSPNLRTAVNSGRTGDAAILLQHATGWMVLVSWPYLLIVGLKYEPLARLLSEDFVPEASLLTILALGMMVSGACGPIELNLLMRGHPRATLTTTALALAVDIILLLVLSGRYGLAGAAAAWAISVAVKNLADTAVSYRWHRAVGPALPALQAAAGALLAVVPIAVATADDLVGLIVTGLVAALVMLGWMGMNRQTLGLHLEPVGG